METFVHLLRRHGVATLVDVRSVPGSRRHPHYRRETLAATLAELGFRYVHLPGLGGLRRPRRDSPNLGWEHPSFRGFADYMQTAAFERALEELMALARGERVAVMCAEAVPWRCHRSLIADALLVRGVSVEHVLDGERRQEHRLTPWARVVGTRITYPPPLWGSVGGPEG